MIFLADFNVTMVENTYDGIRWLFFEKKYTDHKLFTCVAYSPPSNSTRQIDPDEFFDGLLT